jgi:hypothetical protein
MSDKMTDVVNTYVVNTFGFDPATIGIHPRFWWIEVEGDYEFEPGYLYVKARDPGAGFFDEEALDKKNFKELRLDDYDPTYCFYVFEPLEEASDV